MKRETCRSCGSSDLHLVIDLGVQPPSNALLSEFHAPQSAYPLGMQVCKSCWLLQTTYDVKHIELFSEEYPYYSGQSKEWVEHCRQYAEQMIARFGFGLDSNICEIGGNDGTLLKHFLYGRVLNIEPCRNVAKAARGAGVFTSETTIQHWASAMLQPLDADLIISNNVLAHDPDINGFVDAVARNLAPNGVWTIEFPWALNLICQTQFDTIYHEHYSYLSLRPLMELLGRHGLRVFDVEEIPTHGGSLRVYATHTLSREHGPNFPHMALTLAKEEELKHLECYDAFRGRALHIKYALQTFVFTQPNGVYAYGAAAKGNTFLNWCGYTSMNVKAIGDTTPAKIGKFAPGSRIPIIGEEELLAQKPDVVWVLPWNWKNEIKWKLRAKGYKGVIITAIPELTVSQVFTV